MYATLHKLFAERLPNLYAKEAKDARVDGDLVVRVEAGIRMLDVLGLMDAPLDTVWAINQGLAVPALARRVQTDAQRRWLAIYHVLVHRSSLSDWQEDCILYADYPQAWRMYDLPAPADYGSAPARATGRLRERQAVIDEVFSQPLPYQAGLELAKPGYYLFRVGRAEGQVTLSEALVRQAQAYPLPELARAEPARLTYSYECLQALAEQMDQAETERGLRPQQWRWRVDNILRYRTRQADGTLSAPNTEPVVIDGLAHIAGMVGSGKSTLAYLVAFDIARAARPGQRVTLVVSDVADVLRLTDYFNSLLAPDANHPAAVPLLGVSMRAKHLRTAYRQASFHPGTDVWKLRFLDPVCLITQGLASVDDTEPDTEPDAGDHPCSTLYKPEDKDKKKRQHFLCPLFSICPVHQAYRDMPGVPIWITSIGGLSQAKVPPQAYPQRWVLPLWARIYEHSSLVVLDEVDTVQAWFDALLAPDRKLETLDGGLVPETLNRIAPQPDHAFRQSTEAEHWRQTFDRAQPALRNLLGLMEGHPRLGHWLADRPFTAPQLLRELAERFSGATLWRDVGPADRADAPPEAVQVDYENLHALLDIFHRSDEEAVTGGKATALDRLRVLAGQIIQYGRSDINGRTRLMVRAWVDEQLARRSRKARTAIMKRLAKADDRLQALGELCAAAELGPALEVGLATSALDRALRGLFYEWSAVQTLLGTDGQPAPVPTDLLGLVPTPPLGRWRGFRASRAGVDNPVVSLSMFEYAGIGRHVVRHFHHLLEPVSGDRGPNVLAMSGTSWLPESARFHFEADVVGVLEPSADVQAAIRESRFSYLPQVADEVGRGAGHRRPPTEIRVSGTREKMVDNLVAVVKALSIREGDPWKSPLGQELRELEALGKESPAWRDRARVVLMVNSYEQAAIVARLLPSALGPVRYVVPSDDDDGVGGSRFLNPEMALKRSDLEEAGHQARILVAPMGAIGRGYNILSPQTNKAALGAIYFLVRPMTPPFDMLPMVAAMNHFVAQRLAPDHALWHDRSDSVLDQVQALHRQAHQAWVELEHNTSYREMSDAAQDELGASTASQIIQACGRLLRGGVPFEAFFVDAAWVGSELDEAGQHLAAPETSLLAACIKRIESYARTDVGGALYGAFIGQPDRMTTPRNVQVVDRRPRAMDDTEPAARRRRYQKSEEE